MIYIILLLMGGVAAYLAYKIVLKKIYIWFPSYIVWTWKNTRALAAARPPVHIMFMVADHFEPGPNTEIVKEWVSQYPVTVQRHRDADDKPPRHSWFYPSERAAERLDHFRLLSKLTAEGFGEIELHLHHHDDTEETLRQKLQDAKKFYNRMGALITTDGKTTFGFIHGNWALDNSVIINNQNCCGVNNELNILNEEGCYADFTFPAVHTSAQPKKINSIYYAKDDISKPKSYNSGIDVSAGKSDPMDALMLIQGPLTIHFERPLQMIPSIESGGVEWKRPPAMHRVDQWVKANIHVQGQPDWIFIKVHTHGAVAGSMNIFLKGEMEKIYSYLESKYNDGKNYCLHYVTARETYNIVKAAESGLSGNPNLYRDYLLKPYRNTLKGFRKDPD
ncbi:MAG: hypothetical protein EHM45_02080 [Desulfobacteraceae bacterium]|nr:MAG: hypothetical protein EHM45_02080 [Desulfobacteraceae bacterium]